MADFRILELTEEQVRDLLNTNFESMIEEIEFLSDCLNELNKEIPYEDIEFSYFLNDVIENS